MKTASETSSRVLRSRRGDERLRSDEFVSDDILIK